MSNVADKCVPFIYSRRYFLYLNLFVCIVVSGLRNTRALYLYGLTLSSM